MATGLTAILIFHQAGAVGLEPFEVSGRRHRQAPPSAHPFCHVTFQGSDVGHQASAMVAWHDPPPAFYGQPSGPAGRGS